MSEQFTDARYPGVSVMVEPTLAREQKLNALRQEYNKQQASKERDRQIDLGRSERFTDARYPGVSVMVQPTLAREQKLNALRQEYNNKQQSSKERDRLIGLGRSERFTDARYPGVFVMVQPTLAREQKLNALRQEYDKQQASKEAESSNHSDESKKTNPPKETKEAPAKDSTVASNSASTASADAPAGETGQEGNSSTDASTGEAGQEGSSSFSLSAAGTQGTMGAAMRGLMGLNRDHTYDEMAAKHDIQAGQADARARKARANADVDINAAAANDAMTKAAAAQMSAGLTNGSAGVANALETNAQINPLETQQLHEQRRQAYTGEAQAEDASARQAEQSAAYERRQGLTTSEDRANAAAQDADARRIDGYIRSMIAYGQATVVENKGGQQYVIDNKGTKIAVAGKDGRWEPTTAFDDSHISLTATKTKTEAKVTQDVDRLPNLDLSLSEYQALYNLASNIDANGGSVTRQIPKIPEDKQKAVLEAIKKNDAAHANRLAQLRTLVSTAADTSALSRLDALEGKSLPTTNTGNATALTDSPGGRLPVVHLVPDANGAYTFRNSDTDMLQEYKNMLGRDEYTKNAAGKYVGADGKEAAPDTYNAVKSDQELRTDAVSKKVADGSYQVENTASKYQLARDDKGSVVAYRQGVDKPWQLATKQDLTPGSWMYSLRKPNSSELISITAVQQ